MAARAGYACDRPSVDDDSVDVVIGARGWVHDQARVTSPRIEVQLKATAQDILNEEALVFPLPVKNYDDLRSPTAVPRLLFVLRLPLAITAWLTSDEEQMLLRHAAYWLSLADKPETSNTHSVTVHLPRQQLLTVESLKRLMERAARKVPL